MVWVREMQAGWEAQGVLWDRPGEPRLSANLPWKNASDEFVLTEELIPAQQRPDMAAELLILS